MKATTLLLLLSLACVPLALIADEYIRLGDGETTRRPAVSIEDALAIAKKHIQEHKHDISHHYIDSVNLVSDPHPNLKRGRCWRIVWEFEAPHTAGGQLFIYVYMDRSVAEASGI